VAQKRADTSIYIVAQAFGQEAMQYVDYVECYPEGYRRGVTLAKPCQDAKIEGFPTWIINGKVSPIKLAIFSASSQVIHPIVGLASGFLHELDELSFFENACFGRGYKSPDGGRDSPSRFFLSIFLAILLVSACLLGQFLCNQRICHSDGA
jgi:hypothetical protein